LSDFIFDAVKISDNVAVVTATFSMLATKKWILPEDSPVLQLSKLQVNMPSRVTARKQQSAWPQYTVTQTSHGPCH